MGDYEETVTIRLSKLQVVAIEQYAKMHNVSVSYVVRFAIEQMTGVKA